MKLSLLVFAALLAAACAPLGRSARVVTVEMEGWAEEGAEHPGSATRRATADALRRAVERAAGVSLTARTRVRDGAGVSERVVADAAGCVRRYEILSESRSSGGRSVRVRAEVGSGPGPCDGRPALPPAALEESEVAVNVSGAGPLGAAGAEAAASALREVLAGRGWRVVEGSSRFHLSGKATLRAVKDPRLGPLTGSNVELVLRVQTPNGRVVHEETVEAAAVDADPTDAARHAARAAAQEAAASITAAMEGQLWELAKSD